MDLICDELSQVPLFEQVVISKAGKMGVIKTADSQLFSAWNTLFSLDTTQESSLKQLLESNHLVSKVASEC